MVGPQSQPDTPPVVVPKTNRDPIRSLRPAPIYIDVGNVELTIPAMPAVDWLSFLMRPGWRIEDFIIELVPGSITLLLDDEADPFDAEDLVLDIIEEASARHWWIALRLIGSLVETWDVMGAEAVLNGVDAEKLSLAAWIDAMMVLLLRRIDPKQAPMFTAKLEAPPAGEELDVEEMEISASQFMSMAD